MAPRFRPAPRIATSAATQRVEGVAPLGVVATPQRANKILQSSHAPAQLSLFLRPSGAR